VPVREIDSKPQVLSLVHRARGPLESAASLLASDIKAAIEDGAPL
jgi:hypothetical protein